jgi:cold shock protein
MSPQKTCCLGVGLETPFYSPWTDAFGGPSASKFLIGDPLLAIGTVKWFNAQKGYGFIRPDDGGKDVFVHISAVERAGMGALAEGQKLKYDVAMDRGKPAAQNLASAD